MHKRTTVFFAFCICCLVFAFPLTGKTRWSTLHLVPDADFLNSGEFTLGFDGFITKKPSDTLLFRPTIPIQFGITEWVNIEVSYADGMSLGLKGRILGETAKAMPSLAIGVRQLFNHKEVNYFYIDSIEAKEMVGEVFLALSKGVDNIKTRFHLGIQSIPTSDDDQINPFVAIEKYFGLGLYTSLEFYRRQKEFHLSLFANWRLLKKHLEISAGAVDLRAMFFDKDNKFAVSLSPFDSTRFVKPGIWIGLKFHGSFGIGSNKGFMSVEDRMRRQDEMIEGLVAQVDTLNHRLRHTIDTLENVKVLMGVVIDSVINDPTRLKNIIYDKLVSLKTLYDTEPYDPEKVKLLHREIISFRDKAIPSLEDLLLDQKTDRYIRVYAASLLGDIGNTASSDILLDVLATTADPDIKIEVLISLGKLKETRAMYLLEQLANDPNDAIALTAQEVLLRLSKETGAEITRGIRMRPISIDEEKKIPDKTKTLFSEKEALPDKKTEKSVLKEKGEVKPVSDTTYVSEPEKLPEEELAPIEESSFSPDSDTITEGETSGITDSFSEKAAEKNPGAKKDAETVKEDKKTDNISSGKDVSAKESKDKQKGKKTEKKSKEVTRKKDAEDDEKNSERKKERAKRIDEMKNDKSY